MDRALIGNFHQPCPRRFRKGSLDCDFAGNLADVAFLGFAIGTVLSMNLAMGQAHGEPLGAEEVAKVMPELVVYNQKGQPETVAYQTPAPLLLNELQRAHAQVVALQAEVAELRRVTAELAATRELAVAATQSDNSKNLPQ